MKLCQVKNLKVNCQHHYFHTESSPALWGSLFIYPLFISNTYLCRPLRPRTNELPPSSPQPLPTPSALHTRACARACRHAYTNTHMHARRGEQHLRIGWWSWSKVYSKTRKKAHAHTRAPTGRTELHDTSRQLHEWLSPSSALCIQYEHWANLLRRNTPINPCGFFFSCIIPHRIYRFFPGVNI